MLPGMTSYSFGSWNHLRERFYHVLILQQIPCWSGVRCMLHVVTGRWRHEDTWQTHSNCLSRNPPGSGYVLGWLTCATTPSYTAIFNMLAPAELVCVSVSMKPWSRLQCRHITQIHPFSCGVRAPSCFSLKDDVVQNESLQNLYVCGERKEGSKWLYHDFVCVLWFFLFFFNMLCQLAENCSLCNVKILI